MDSEKVLVLDGSPAIQLEKHIGNKIDGDPLWSCRHLAENPQAVKNMHKDYLRAGSDIIETNTYQASIPGFMKHLGLSKEDSFKLIKSAVKLARESIEECRREGVFAENGRKPLVAGSMGSYGAHLHDGSEYTGNYIDTVSEETIIEYHRPKMQALIQGGVDLLAIETIPSRKEAEILIGLLKKEFPDTKAWLCFSCKDNGTETVHGDNFQDTVRHCYNLNPQQIIAVGVNCAAPATCLKLLSAVNTPANKKLPLIVYSNSGEKYDPAKGWDNHPDKIEKYISLWLSAGVKYIGGCCRVGDDYIKKMREEVNNHMQRQNGKSI